MRPLHHACNKNHEIVIKMLIKAGSDLNAKDENGDAPLHWSSSRGVLNNVLALIDNGAELGTTNGQGVTCLHKAAVFGHHAVAKKLIEMGANADAKDANGDTALHCAAKSGLPLVVKTLLNSGASADLKNGEGKVAKDLSLDKKTLAMFEGNQFGDFEHFEVCKLYFLYIYRKFGFFREDVYNGCIVCACKYFVVIYISESKN